MSQKPQNLNSRSSHTKLAKPGEIFMKDTHCPLLFPPRPPGCDIGSCPAHHLQWLRGCQHWSPEGKMRQNGHAQQLLKHFRKKERYLIYHICIYTYKYVYIYIYIHVIHMYTCMYMYVCAHIVFQLKCLKFNKRIRRAPPPARVLGCCIQLLLSCQERTDLGGWIYGNLHLLGAFFTNDATKYLPRI